MRVICLLLPRAITLEEVAWSPQDVKGCFGFVRRLKKQSIQFNEDISCKEQVVYKEKLLITLQGKAAIYYTTGGSIPDSFPPEFTDPEEPDC